MKGENMDQNTTNTLAQNVDMLFSNLENFTQSEGVIGTAVPTLKL
jgi:hypothetical protein